MGRDREERVAEYVDSPSMVHRLRAGSVVAARILGTLGVYKVRLDTRRKQGECTCPSEIQPCKHVEALRRTWKKRPGSFADLDELLDVALRSKSRADLVQLMREMALESPSSLTALGALGFREIAPWDEEDPEGFWDR